MKNNKISKKRTVKCSKNRKVRKTIAETRLPVYMSNETKENLHRLRIEIYQDTGKFVSLTQIVRDAIENQLEQEQELIQKYTD